MPSVLWTRRQFSETLGSVAGTFFLPGRVRAASVPMARGFAYVGSAGMHGARDSIQAFEVSGSRWRPLQTVAALRPAHLAAHPTLPMLYVVHAVGLWDDLPRGAVSAYSIGDAGRLTLCNTQPLSLSATHPRHAAVSPDGRYLFVAAGGGGLYNLLPVAGDGRLEAPVAIRKELGLLEDSVAKPASPRQVLFHPNGVSALTVDAGQESVAVVGFGPESIALRSRIRAHAGAGPSQIALSPSGDWLYAQHSVSGSISVHRLTDFGIQPAVRTWMPRRSGPSHMAMHPGGRFLFTSGGGGLTVLRVDPDPGYPSVADSLRLQASPSKLALTLDGAHLFGIGRSGEILQLPFDPASGALYEPRSVARVDGAISLLLRQV